MKSEHLMKIAKMLSDARKAKKMANGGPVEDSEMDLDQEHERSLGEIQRQGDQHPISNPAELKAELELAAALHEENEEHEVYNQGGLVEPMSGDEKPVVNHAQENADPSLSEEQKKAIEARKAKRRFMR